ncbi:GNAT family N-acetyltransferase [Massilia sp. RP-1-19]|uniref:GNAT family N-acetyltransferase n=1 Tax=Massilia polaris TaxID=2728846 RepID=A0A848HP42_9BURK|nr:GNAT family N-acetyltransferase [Massilia polaris]NML60318.1 GNAT family N-acetyltransferase [Massilia polaris]
MTVWERRDVPFKFQLSDMTLFSVRIPLQVRSERLVADTPPTHELRVPADALLAGSQGYVVRGLPVEGEPRVLSKVGDFICYVPQQYHHCYIDLSQTFEQYQKKFSSKTRSTISRKIKKFADHCGGQVKWKLYREPGEMKEYFALARAVSKLTYQERLLDAGLPESDEFQREAEQLAAAGRIRAWILFDGERPVSYLYCPVADGVLSYSYVGYDPAYMDKSVGLVLQWIAVEQLFSEGIFKYFDFTEGQSDHKRLFSTHQRRCANVFFIRDSLRSRAIVFAHRKVDSLSVWAGEMLERHGLKAKLKRLLRGAG